MRYVLVAVIAVLCFVGAAELGYQAGIREGRFQERVACLGGVDE